MVRVPVQERRLLPRALALAAIGFAVGGLAGCASVPDAVNPVEWAKSVGSVFSDDDSQAVDAKAKAERRPVPGADRPFPNLSTVPGRPAVTPVGDRDRIAQGLRADRENARYADEAARQPGPPSPAIAAVAGRPGPIPVEPSPPVRSADPVSPQAARAPATQAQAMQAPATQAQAVPVQPAPGRVAAAPRTPVSKETLEAQSVEPAAGSPASDPVVARAAPAAPVVPPRAALPEPQASGQASSPARGQALGQASGPSAAASRAPERRVASRTPSGREVVSDLPAQGVSYRAAVIYFDPDSAALSPEDIAAIREVARFHRQTGGMVRIVGHAAGDSPLTAGQRHRDATVRVSSARAEAVARQLVQFGVSQRSVAVRGVGEGEPMVTDGSADQATRNRRAEIYIDY